MAIHTKITKISETNCEHTYAIFNDTKTPDCYAVLNNENKTITIYKDVFFKNLIFEYVVFEDENIVNKPFGGTEYSRLFVRSMQKLIPALRAGIFPQHLDKCS